MESDVDIIVDGPDRNQVQVTITVKNLPIVVGDYFEKHEVTFQMTLQDWEKLKTSVDNSTTQNALRMKYAAFLGQSAQDVPMREQATQEACNAYPDWSVLSEKR